jgi:hypothetical protein
MSRRPFFRPRLWRLVVLPGVALLLAIQLVPYGRSHANRPISQDAPWSSPHARQLAVAACYDCHSNRTRWPWYTDVAPISWYVENHVSDGRRTLNFSEWDRPQQVEHLAGTVRDGSMPPSSYTLIHRNASLSAAERETLRRALAALPNPGRG